MSDDALLARFRRAFCGNLTFFTIHVPPFRKGRGKEKDSSKVLPAWCGFAEYETKSFPDVPEGFAKGDFVPLTDDYYRKHLNGELGLAVTPIFSTSKQQNVCYHAAIDIDVDTNFTWFVNRLEHFGLKCIPTVSKSNGLHVYFIFMQPEPAADVIKTLERIVAVFGIDRLFTNEKDKSKVEIFPKAAVCVPREKNTNGLLLPFFDTAHKSKQNMLTAEGKLVGLVKAMSIIDSRWTSVKELNSALDELPYSDAPYCVQTVLLTGALQEGDYRNNFLFSAAIYLQKKFKEDFGDALFEMNECLEAPLEENDVKGIYISVTTKGYDNYSCQKSPCSDYCNKKLCAEREYGVGKARNNRFTGVDCWGDITRYDTGDGKEPYYTWEVRVRAGEDFRIVQIDSHKDLLNQAAVQQNCLRDLNWVPFTVKANDWLATVLKGLEGIDNRTIKVARAADTTEMSMLRESFMQFLTHKQIQKNGQPYMIKLSQVYHADGAYFFTTKGVMDYLRFEKYALGKINLHEWLLRQGCDENAELNYKTPAGEEKTIECWKMPENEELLAMGAFYEDVYEGSVDIAQNNLLHKEDSTDREDDGGGVRF
jgi:hypothetical protein